MTFLPLPFLSERPDKGGPTDRWRRPRKNFRRRRTRRRCQLSAPGFEPSPVWEAPTAGRAVSGRSVAPSCWARGWRRASSTPSSTSNTSLTGESGSGPEEEFSVTSQRSGHPGPSLHRVQSPGKRNKLEWLLLVQHDLVCSVLFWCGLGWVWCGLVW